MLEGPIETTATAKRRNEKKEEKKNKQQRCKIEKTGHYSGCCTSYFMLWTNEFDIFYVNAWLPFWKILF